MSPTDDEMFDVAMNRVQEMATELEEMADRQDRRDNGASEVLRDVAAEMRHTVRLHNRNCPPNERD